MVQHPERGELDVVITRNCPEIEASMCLELIAEVEQRRAAAMIRAMQPAEIPQIGSRGWHTMDDDDFLRAIQAWARKEFLQAPESVREKVAPKGCHAPAESGLNRHTRRRLERGGSNIHLFLWSAKVGSSRPLSIRIVGSAARL